MKLTFSLCLALVCAVAPALAVPVSVSVVGPDNKPISDAKLSWFETTYTRDDPKDMREPVGVAGVFAWNWDGDFDDKRPVGQKPFLRVRVEAPGLAPQFQVIGKAQTTIQLQPLRTWSGRILDQNQKPIVGATILLSEVKPTFDFAQEKELSGAFIDLETKIAKTDADGRWSLAGVPARGQAQITLSAPDFVAQRLSLTIGEGDAAPIYLKPGGTLTGVLLAPDGTPVAGETVSAGFGSMAKTKSDAQGRFTIKGVEPGETSVYVGDIFFDRKKNPALPPYLFERPKTVAVEAGKTADVGEIKAQKGLLIRARVVGADTKMPLPDARFRIGYSNVADLVGADGILQSRILPRKINPGFDRPTIENAGYVDFDLPINAFDTRDETLDLGTIELKRGNKISGTIRLEGVPPGTNPPGISFSREGKYDFVSADDNGSFASTTLGAGSYSVNLNGNDGDWEIVSPRSVKLPEFGAEFKPVEVVIKRLTPVVPAIKSARGRVLDEGGQGVAGVTVRARVVYSGGSYSDSTATTGKDGGFTFDGADRVANIEIEGADHPGYLIGGKAVADVKDGVATISGLVAKKRGAVYSGHVAGSDGKSAVGAWVVVVEARDYEPVQTDKDGKFDLVDVPLVEFTLLAAQGRDWTQQKVKSNEPGAQLKLETTSVYADKSRAMAQLMTLGSGVQPDKLFAAWDVLGADGVERYIRRNGEPAPAIMALYGYELARRDPAQLLKRAPELLAGAKGEAREDLEAQINLVRAASDDAGARTDANAWLDEQKQNKREIKPRSVTQLLQMTAVAQKLKRADAAQWLDYAAAIAGQLKGDKENNAFAWSNALANLGADAIARFADGYDAPIEFQLLGYTTPILARAGDVAGAKQALARMETLLADPLMAEFAEQAAKQRRVLPASTLQSVQSAVAGALATTDPVAAFELAQKTTDIFTRVGSMISVGAGAQKAGNADIAEKALRDVMKARIGNVEYFAQAASIGARLNPKLGEELFALAKDKTLPKKERSRSDYSIGAWAFYHAPFDAAQSRVLIEREWDWRLPAAIKTKNESFSDDYRALYELVHGMSAIDAKRASEMQTSVDAIEAKNYGKAMSQFDIAIAALATAQQRAKLGLDAQF